MTLFIRGKVSGILSIVNNVLSGFSNVEGNQSINPTSIVTDLKSRLSLDIAEKIKELTKAREEKNTKTITMTDISERINQLRTSLKIVESKHVTAKENLKELVGIIDEETNLESIQNGLLNEALEMQKTHTGLKTEFNNIHEKIRQYNFLNKGYRK